MYAFSIELPNFQLRIMCGNPSLYSSPAKYGQHLWARSLGRAIQEKTYAKGEEGYNKDGKGMGNGKLVDCFPDKS